MEERVLAVQRMQDYIEQHLLEKITLMDLSKVSMFSPWYSYRIFLKYTELSPADYIRKLRLSQSALRLKEKDCKIADIAFEMGFGSVDGYQRAFQREFRCNPREYSLNPVPICLFQAYGVKYRKIERKNVMSDVKNVFIQVVEKPERNVILKRGEKATDYMEYCEEVGCDVWGILKSMVSAQEEPICLWLTPEYIKPGTSQYVQAVEVSNTYKGMILEGFEMIKLPATKYLQFQGEPFEEEDYCQAIEEVQKAIKKYNPNSIGYSWDKTSPIIQLEPVGTRGYIELHPIK